MNDPYVRRAKDEGYRGRAAFKILELDDKYRFLVPGARVVDLGLLRRVAGARWPCVRVNALGDTFWQRPVGRVLGDRSCKKSNPLPGAEIHLLDFLEEGADEKVKAWLGGKADVVMSDMAAASSGHKQTDHLADHGACARQRPCLRLTFWMSRRHFCCKSASWWGGIGASNPGIEAAF